MSREIAFESIARTEFLEAFTRYEVQRAGLGFEFLASLEETVRMIAERPRMFRRVRGSSHRAILRRFPYAVYFREEPTRILIAAVFHASRDPRTLERKP